MFLESWARLVEFDPRKLADPQLIPDCMAMLKDKTESRVADFLEQHPTLDAVTAVQGFPVKSVQEYLSAIDWSLLATTNLPGKFHGDPQPENVIVRPDGTFVFIDWRDSFGASLDIGDQYYDLGKIYHACIVSNKLIQQGKFGVQETNGQATLQLELHKGLVPILYALRNRLLTYGLSWKKVELLGSLQYITIASLYQQNPTYQKFLFLLGKLCLATIEYGYSPLSLLEPLQSGVHYTPKRTVQKSPNLRTY